MKTNANDPINAIINDDSKTYYEGLTKREYFASMAMQAMISIKFSTEIAAIHAVIYADNLIEQLNKED